MYTKFDLDITMRCASHWRVFDRSWICERDRSTSSDRKWSNV